MAHKSVKCLSPLNHVVFFCAPKIPDLEPLLSKLSPLLAGLILSNSQGTLYSLCRTLRMYPQQALLSQVSHALSTRLTETCPRNTEDRA